VSRKPRRTARRATRRGDIVPTQEFSVGTRRIYVFDDLCRPELVEALGLWLLRLDYQPRESFDNELSVGISPAQLQRLPELPELLERVLARFYPAMVRMPAAQSMSHAYAAALRYGDHTVMHRDIQCEDCVTFLYYGNLVWQPAWGGETVFFDDAENACHCVAPKPGRLVLFNAAIYHRTGVPQRHCPSTRYGLSIFYRCAAARAAPHR